ncbi:MAG: epoxyqueuosine reductase [Clostridia bacterium]|nr:epoxyqueuosine reductase [Clostridia bacterium]
MVNQIKTLALELGAWEVGFSEIEPAPEYPKLKHAISIVVKLSDSVIDAIDNAPTFTYFHHYRSVNALIDQITLKIGMFLEKNGAQYVCVPASQSHGRAYFGLYSHKLAATKAGLGTIGRNALFLSKKYGARVRLGTILTDMDLSEGFQPMLSESLCTDCMLCVKACPALALSGEAFDPMQPEKKLVDAKSCSEYMKEKFQLIGRGSVCGICIRSCPYKGQN